MKSNAQPKLCVLEPDRACTECGECQRCDLDPTKLCDNCMRCITDGEEFMRLDIDEIIVDEPHAHCGHHAHHDHCDCEDCEHT